MTKEKTPVTLTSLSPTGAAYAFLQEYAKTHERFESQEVLQEYLKTNPVAPDNGWSAVWGYIFTSAQKSGFIKKGGVIPATTKNTHGHMVSLWISNMYQGKKKVHLVPDETIDSLRKLFVTRQITDLKKLLWMAYDAGVSSALKLQKNNSKEKKATEAKASNGVTKIPTKRRVPPSSQSSNLDITQEELQDLPQEVIKQLTVKAQKASKALKIPKVPKGPKAKAEVQPSPELTKAFVHLLPTKKLKKDWPFPNEAPASEINVGSEDSQKPQ